MTDWVGVTPEVPVIAPRDCTVSGHELLVKDLNNKGDLGMIFCEVCYETWTSTEEQ